MKNLNIFRAVTFIILLVSSNLLLSQNIIDGVVTYHNDNLQPLEGVRVELYDLNNNVIKSTVSDINGEYSLDSVPSSELILRTSSTIPASGSNILDVFLIYAHLSNSITLENIEFEAADVNNDGDITGIDLAMVFSSLIFGNNTTSANWQFDEVNIDFSNRALARDTINIWGTSEGDVDPSWEPSGRDIDLLLSANSSPKTVSTESTFLYIESDYYGNLAGYQFNVEFPSNSIEILNVVGPDKNIEYNVDRKKGILSISWLNKTNNEEIFLGNNLFSLEVRSLNNNKFGIKDFNLLPGGMIIDDKGKSILDAKISLPSVEILSDVIEVSTYPNPVHDAINFDIYTPDNETFNIKIYDVAGNLISERNTSVLETGNNNFTFDVNSLNQGQYIYMITSSNGNFVLPGRFFKIH